MVVGIDEFVQRGREGDAGIGAEPVVGLLQAVAAPGVVRPPPIGRGDGFLKVFTAVAEASASRVWSCSQRTGDCLRCRRSIAPRTTS
ncbi:hypothetical protein [Streptomyces subrutilus]|uniref:hypothetical protein n=1 Tax=Streptomyces subrutilus TaxID=36818 RepID=UPI0033C86CD8